MTIESLPGCRRLIATAAFLACCCAILCSDPAVAQSDASKTSGTWRDEAHGMTLTLPAGCRAMEDIPPGALVRIVSDKGEDDFTITVSRRIYGELVGIPELLDASLMQIGAAKLFAQEVLELKSERVGEYDAGMAYYLVSDIRRTPREELKRTAGTSSRQPDEPWVMGQAFLQVGYCTVIAFQLDVDEGRFEQVRPIFESIYKSLRINSEQVDQRREELLRAFIDWRKTLAAEHLHTAAVKDQWRRITDDGTDVGYMRVRQHRLKKLGLPGLQVSIETHITDMKRTVDSKSDFFLSDDDRTEIWSIRMTSRPLHPKKRKAPEDLHLTLGESDGTVVTPSDKTVTIPGVELEPETASWVETGLRDGDVITVSRQSAAGVKKYRWHPPAPYLSMVELYMLEQLGQSLPWDHMGFYANFPGVGKLTFQTAKLERNKDKSYRVLLKPTPNSPQHITHYDAAGLFKSMTTPTGRLIRRTERSVIEAKWPKP